MKLPFYIFLTLLVTGGASAGIFGGRSGVENTPLIVALTSAPSNFSDGSANATIGTLGVTTTRGAFAGTFALATSASCAGTDNASFAITGNTIKVGASNITTAKSYNICVRATDAAFRNSPFDQALTLTGNVIVSSNTLLPTAPSGYHWTPTFADEFAAASPNSGTANSPVTLDATKWQLDHYCGDASLVPYTSPTYGCSNASITSSDTVSNGLLTMTISTASPAARNVIDTWMVAGDAGHGYQPITGFVQKFGYFVYSAKLPTCSSAEWYLGFFGKNNWSGGVYAELAIATKKLACNYSSYQPYEIDSGGPPNIVNYETVNAGADLTLGMHQYGVWWRDDCSPHGAVTIYFDGNPVTAEHQLQSTGFDPGIFFDVYWSPENVGGAAASVAGSTMQFDWIRAYQLDPDVVAQTITSIGSTNTFFAAQASNANSTVGSLSTVVSGGSFAGTYALASSGTCTGADNAAFVITGSSLKVGSSDVTTARTYDICVRGTDPAFSNSPFYQAISLTGTSSGATLTTDTFTNYSGGTLAAGTPISFGKAFRYGDIMPSTHPVIRDASTHTPLAGQQWDEISTWRENGGNGSWRHAVWAAWLPSSLANGASIQVEYVVTAGSYSETSHQPLSALCSGGAAHDLKIHLSDIRNQNDTVRDSGDATFRVCDNIANVGRDAPRHIRAGNVYDEYVVSGMFVYATSGNKDPLLYATCNIDIFTKSSDGTSPGDVRWVCEDHNSFMNVAAGSTGNAGNPGPAGFAADPQSISYKPEVLDGSTSVLNWTGMDATISSSNNPIQPMGSAGCYAGWGGSYCMQVPSWTGINMGYSGEAVRVTCSATCPAGMTTDHLYYVSPVGAAGPNGYSSTYYALLLGPVVTYGPFFFMTSSQGTGTTTLGYRVQHYHWTTIPLLDQTGQDNWAPFGSATRQTRKVYPNFTSAEKLYWEQTGMVIPMDRSQTVSDFTPAPGQGNGTSPYYTPNGVGAVIGGSGGGDRPDLGTISEWAAQAFLNSNNRNEANWDYARLFSLGQPTHGPATILNEATGRIPVINNGPPTGPGGNGSGGSYAGLGAPMNNVNVQNGAVGMVDLNNSVPSFAPAAYGLWSGGTYLAWMPSFDSLTYLIFGSRHWLDFMRFQPNRDYTLQRTGPGPELGQGYTRDNNARFTDGNIYHYYGILYDCCQGRGYAWMMRDFTFPAALGGNSDIERSYYNDFLVESRNYYPMWLKFKDGPGNSNYSTSIVEPGGTGGEGVTAEPFIQTYIFDAAWNMMAFLHEPLGSTWMSQSQRYTEGNCGARLAGALPYYCFDYYYVYAINNGADGSVTSQQGSTGLYTNGTDASDFGIAPTISLLSGGQWRLNSYIVNPGDQVMSMSGFHIFFSPGAIDQLPGNRYFTVTGPVTHPDPGGTSSTFYIQCTAADHTAFPSQCPVAGQAFTGFTRGGSTIQNDNSYSLKLRLAYDGNINGYYYSSPNYMDYGGQKISGLHIAGYDVTQAMAQWATRGGGYNPSRPINNWDRNIVIPGLPTAVNSLGGTPSDGTSLPAPPSGYHWTKTFSEEFNTFNTSVWDVDHYCGGCASPGATNTVSNGILTNTIQTTTPSTRNIIDTWTDATGNGNHAFSQRYGFFVYNIKLPTCSSGEYDVEFFGRDQWPGARTTGPYAEMAIASGKSECHYRNLRPYQSNAGSGFNGFTFMSDPDVGVDVTLAYHQYGLLWVNDGSAHGSVTMYFDGTPFSGPVQLQSTGWDVGLFFDLYWSPVQAGDPLGGAGVDAAGSVMQIDWVRAYQLAPG